MRVTFGSIFRDGPIDINRTTEELASRPMIVDSAHSDIINGLTNVQTRAAGGRSTILTQVQRDALAGEVRGAASAILTAVDTSYRGMYLFPGGQSVDVVQTLEALATAVQAGDMAGIDRGLVDVGQAFDRLTESISAMTQADAAYRAALGARADAGRLSLDYVK